MNTLTTIRVGKRNYHRHFFRTLTHEQEETFLTDRELDVLKAVALGHGNKQMAYDLAISKKTVEKHRQALYKKLRFNCQADIIHFALARGVVENKFHNEPTQ